MKVRPYRRSDGRVSNVQAELRRKLPHNRYKILPLRGWRGSSAGCPSRFAHADSFGHKQRASPLKIAWGERWMCSCACADALLSGSTTPCVRVSGSKKRAANVPHGAREREGRQGKREWGWARGEGRGNTGGEGMLEPGGAGFGVSRQRSRVEAGQGCKAGFLGRFWRKGA